ncbi:MAG: hypothetical protein ACO3O3_09710 [Ilumatobacteraceae bacterium]|jgi:hypothetical protein
MSRKSSGNGHWKNPSRIKLDPDNSFGFVYLIVNTLTGQRYIGKKQYHQYRKGVRARPSDWRTYTSSSRPLNEDIKRQGKCNFHFEILAEFNTRGGLVYGETHLQHVCNVLTETNGDDERLFYNQFIDKIRFIPAEFMTAKKKKKIMSRVLQDFN